MRRARCQGCRLGPSLVERHGLSRGVAGAGNAECGEIAAVDGALEGRKIQVAREQLLQRGVVEQGDRPAVGRAAAQEREQPAEAVPQRAPRVGAVDVMHVEVLPHRHEPAHAAAKVRAVHRDHGGVDRPGRGAADDGKRRAHVRREELRERTQHPDLVGGARAAPRHDQPDLRPAALRHRLPSPAMVPDRTNARNRIRSRLHHPARAVNPAGFWTSNAALTG